MQTSVLSAFGFAVLLAVFEIGSATRCYQCNSQQDPTCATAPPKKYLVDCSSELSSTYNSNYLSRVLPVEVLNSVVGAPRYCYKIVMQSGTTVRTCLDTNPAALSHTCSLIDGVARNSPTDATKQIKHCSVCDKDECNGASSLSFSLPLATLGLIATYLLFK